MKNIIILLIMQNIIVHTMIQFIMIPRHTPPPSPSPLVPPAFAKATAGRRGEGNDLLGAGTQGGATLALGYYHIVPTGLRFGSALPGPDTSPRK